MKQKFSPDKALGQHFLKDKSLIEKITSDFASACDVIIEVGPGPGALTESLSQKNKPFYLIEFDSRFIENLTKWVSRDHIYEEDALNFDFKTISKLHPNQKIWLVSNLPYNISAPLFLKFTQELEIQYMTLMFQKEVGDKTYPRADEKYLMNSLLTISMNFWKAKLLSKVKPGAFNPPPKVDSVVVSYERKTPEISDFHAFEKFSKNLFSLRRKQIGQSLKPLNLSVDEISSFPVNPKLRAEALSYEQVLKLFDFFKKVRK